MVICSKQQSSLPLGSNEYYVVLIKIWKTHVPLHREWTTYLQKLKYVLSGSPLLKAPFFRNHVCCTFIFLQRDRDKRTLQFSNGSCAWCYYGHTISILSEAVQEFSTFHAHPWFLVSGNTGWQGLFSSHGHSETRTLVRRYNPMTTVKKRVLEGLRPGKKHCSLLVTHSPSSPGPLIRTTHMGCAAVTGLKFQPPKEN